MGARQGPPPRLAMQLRAKKKLEICFLGVYCYVEQI